jgi:hypothetical protein
MSAELREAAELSISLFSAFASSSVTAIPKSFRALASD